MTAPSYIVEGNLVFIRLRWSLSDKMDHSFGGKVLEGNSVNVRECHAVGSLSSIMGNMPFVRSNPAIHPFLRNCHGCHIDFM